MSVAKSQRQLSKKATDIIAGTFGAANERPDPQAMSESIARGTTIVGKMLEGISDEYHGIGQKYASWLTNFGILCWNLVEMSVPHTLSEILSRYWLKLGTILAILIFALGVVSRAKVEWETGLVLFAFVLAASLVRIWLKRLMLKLDFPRWIRVPLGVIGMICTLVFLYVVISGLRLEYGLLVQKFHDMIHRMSAADTIR
jgi:hypothetical protein